MSEYTFTKMHGCGNDYVYFNCFENEIDNPEKLSIAISDRHFGVGADGIILICKSQKADAKMRMFNADGSEGKMCGNGIRCVAKFLVDNGIILKDKLTIETLSGIKELKVNKKDGLVDTVTVDMGKPSFDFKDIGVLEDLESVLGYPIFIDGKTYEINCVSVGNPHCVVFLEKLDGLVLSKIGPLFEKHKLFPQGINVEFVEKINEKLLKVRVWERGSGETLACGTGACAVVSTCVKRGFVNKDTDVIVSLRGGDLSIKYTEDDRIFMTGPAKKVFDGKVTPEGLVF